MSGEVPKVDQAKCAHARVYYSKHEDHGVVHSEHWYCTECHLEFSPMTWRFEPGTLTVMEPVATLRDQFAMAALTGILAFGVGTETLADDRKYWTQNSEDIDDSAERSYLWADAMMKARKT